jgi:serine/threonine-protein kinase
VSGGESNKRNAKENEGNPGLSGAFGPESLSRDRLSGRYELLGLIGVGGMGAVYRARDFELDEVVALKMLRKELVASEDMLARFRQEVKLARRVTHRNVARTYDIGEHAGEKFLTMEYIEGESLGSMLGRGAKLPIGECVHIATEICAGLTAAHSSGIIHRDLKPDNVLIAKDRRVVITDFGIARAVDPDVASHATMGVVTGTPAYMAPEQVEGTAIDLRVDIYALGEILYEMLTGVATWSGESLVQIAAARLHRPPPDPRLVRQDIPDALASVVARALARKPEDRFANAAEVATALLSLTLPQISAAPLPPPSSAVIVSARPATPAERDPVKDPKRTETPHGDKTLAVLLFRNAGPPDDAYLAEGLTEDLIDALSVVRGLRVRALSQVQSFREPSADARSIGQSLEVQVVADGSVRRVGDTMRVNARLISVADGFQLWARRFERPVGEFLQVGDEIATAISEALLVQHKPAPREAPTDPIALDLYLRGRHELQFAFREGTQRALTLLAEALKRAPKDPLILSGYAMAQVREIAFGDNVDAAESVARNIVEEATRLAPNLPEPHLAVAALELSVGKSDTAAESIKRALSLGRPGAEAHDLLGVLLSETGPLELAISHIETALALEPRLHHRRGELARYYEIIGEPEKAKKMFASAPDEARLAPGYWMAWGRWLAWRHDEEGIAKVMALPEKEGPPTQLRGLFDTLANKRIRPEVESALSVRIAQGGRARRRTAFFGLLKAEVLAYIGDYKASVAALNITAAAGCFDRVWFEHCPLVEPIRTDPVFRATAESVAARAKVVRDILGV